MNVRVFVSRILILSSLLALATAGQSIAPLYAQEVDKDAIQSDIDKYNQSIADLEKEIAQYQTQLRELGAQSQTLRGAIGSIDVSRRQTSTQIQLTQNKMRASELRLQQLSGDISQKEYEIALNKQSIAQSIRDLSIEDDHSIIERIFAAGSLADAWTATDATLAVNDALRENVQELNGITRELGAQKQDESATKSKLSELDSELSTQKRQLDVNRAEKDRLLSQTKSQESAYQALVAQKRAEQATFQSALYQLSLQLAAADTTSVPVAGQGVLRWPVTNVTVTQLFGRTSDSGRLYASGTHDGIDLGMPTGTPVYASLAGTVYATNEGAVQNCQYGKWVIIKHANGLATLYAHLSQINVSSGQSVSTGQVIGYSGMTGYATGPHLHFTVYVSSSLTLKQYTCKSGSTVTVPIAPPNGYLNPMSYL